MPLEESVGPLFHKATSTIKDGLIRRGKALRSAAASEGMGFGLIMGLEELRTWFVNPQSSMLMESVYAKENKPLPLPVVTPENTPPSSMMFCLIWVIFGKDILSPMFFIISQPFLWLKFLPKYVWRYQ